MITKQIYPWYSSCEEYSYSVGNAELRDYLNYANIPTLILGVLAAGNTLMLWGILRQGDHLNYANIPP